MPSAPQWNRRIEMKKSPDDMRRHCIVLNNQARKALEHLQVSTKNSYSKIIRDLLVKAYKPR